uniref:Uncharacterized protein n=1 Tax=Mycena chlorophos TaxID=658473 RepID=A0ABQ0LXY1_MYCCL|nr:predicted protein [Mycena chlorophos]
MLVAWSQGKVENGADAELASVTQLLQRCSEQWLDADRFLAAMLACGAHKSVDVLGVDGVAEAYAVFGWSVVRTM